MAESTQGRASDRRIVPPARFANQGDLGAACGQGSITRQMLPGITGVQVPRTTLDQSRSQPTAGAATGVTQPESETREAQLSRIMREDVGGENAGSDNAGSDSNSSDDEFEVGTPSVSVTSGDSEGPALDAGSSSEPRVGGDKGKKKLRADSPSPLPRPSASGITSQLRQLRKSVDRHRGREYPMWPVFLLQQACAMRKITGQSKERDGDKLAILLQNLDRVADRPSPYMADLEDRITGETPASNMLTKDPETADVPESLVLAMRGAIKNGLSIDKNKMYDCSSDGKSYFGRRVLEVIAEQDAASGNNCTTGSRRKSKHCVPRMVELMCDERFRARFAESRTQFSRAELDRGEKGKKRHVYVDLWESFKDEGVKVVNSLADDMHISAAGIDPNVVHQPDITFDKFMAMMKEVNKEYGDCHHNFKKSGSHDNFHSFCQDSLDTYYYGEVMGKHEEVLAVCDQLLPADVQRENSGVGRAASGEVGAKAAAADAKRRETAKRTAKEQNAHLAKAPRKTPKKSGDVEGVAASALHAVVSGLGLPDGGLRELLQPAAEPAGGQASSSRATVDGKTANLEFFNTLYKQYEGTTEKLEEAEAAAAGGSAAALKKVTWRKKMVDKIEKEMENWQESSL